MAEDAARLAIKAALGDPEARLAMALDAQAIAMFDWDLLTGTLEWPAGAEKMFGLEEGSIFDWHSWSQYVPPEDQAAVSLVVAQAEQQGLPTFRFIYRLQSRQGRRTIEGSAKCIYDDDGKLVRAIGINMDLTERDQREQEIKARESQIQSILATVPDAMIAIDEQGIVQQFSRTAEIMLGYSASEIIGSNISIIMPHNIAVEHDGYINTYLITGQRHVIGQSRLLTAKHRDGSLIPIELSVGEAFIGSDRIFTGFIRDMSDQLRAERESAELLNQLSLIDRAAAMGGLAAGLAHEINQPLTASSNYLTAARLLLSKQNPSPRVDELMELAVNQIQRAGRIIRNLRQFVSRSEVEFKIEPIEQVVRESVNLVLVGDSRLAVTVHYEFHQLNDYMIADKLQIQQVLVNLIRNASEIDRPAGIRKYVWVSVKSLEGGYVEFSIRDNGSGIEKDQIHNIFTAGLTTKHGENLGIGLLICKQIIDSHNGSIGAYNSENGGAVFFFTVQSADRINPSDR